MIRKIGMLVPIVLALTTPTLAQDRISLKPVFTPRDEIRYAISALVETNVTPDASSNGLNGRSRRELEATVLVRTIGVTENGEADLEATIEKLNFKSASDLGGAQSPVVDAAAGQKITLRLSPNGQMSKCIVPAAPGYQIVLDILLSMTRWYPASEVSIGGGWETEGAGPVFSPELSPISRSAKTSYKLSSAAPGRASIEGIITQSHNGTAAVNPSVSQSDLGLAVNGTGVSKFEVDLQSGRVVNGTTECRLEGNVAHTQRSAEGTKPERRTGGIVETAKLSVKLVK